MKFQTLTHYEGLIILLNSTSIRNFYYWYCVTDTCTTIVKLFATILSLVI